MRHDVPTTHSTRGRIRDRTRALLLDAAVRVFARKGAGAAAIHEIAAEAGVSNGTFYNYFRSREELVEAASERLAERFHAEIAVSRAGVSDPAERVAVGCRRFVLQAMQDPDVGGGDPARLEQQLGPRRARGRAAARRLARRPSPRPAALRKRSGRRGPRAGRRTGGDAHAAPRPRRRGARFSARGAGAARLGSSVGGGSRDRPSPATGARGRLRAPLETRRQRAQIATRTIRLGRAKSRPVADTSGSRNVSACRYDPPLVDARLRREEVSNDPNLRALSKW